MNEVASFIFANSLCTVMSEIVKGISRKFDFWLKARAHRRNDFVVPISINSTGSHEDPIISFYGMLLRVNQFVGFIVSITFGSSN